MRPAVQGPFLPRRPREGRGVRPGSTGTGVPGEVSPGPPPSPCTHRCRCSDSRSPPRPLGPAPEGKKEAPATPPGRRPLTSVLRPRGRRSSLARGGEAVPGARLSRAPAHQGGRGRRRRRAATGPGLCAGDAAPSRPRRPPHGPADTPAHSRLHGPQRHRPRLCPRPDHHHARRARANSATTPEVGVSSAAAPSGKCSPAEVAKATGRIQTGRSNPGWRDLLQ